MKFMTKSELKKKLKEAILRDYILSEEFQDKYFLKKSIKSVLTDQPESLIYKTIEYCNKQLDPPRKRNKFIKTFVRGYFNFQLKN